MKILQVIPYFSPEFGGSVTVLYQLSTELVRKGHHVTILTSDYKFDEKFAQNIGKDGVKVIPFRTIVNFGHFIYMPSSKTWLRDKIKNFDIIHMHNYRSYQNIVVRKYAIKYGIPYIVQAHGSVLPSSEKQGLKKIFDVIWGNKILQDASRLIALTDTESEQYMAMGVPKNKIEIIPNGIDLAEFRNLPEFGKFRKQYEIQENCKIILYVGRLHKSKGLDLLIDAFYELNKTKFKVQLIIIGPDDGYLQQLFKKILEFDLQDKIRIIGFISSKKKIQAFIDSDVFVTPLYSGFPVTFLEACACGTPIVTTNNGDVLDWIDNKVGFVVDYDKTQLSDIIQKILTDESLKKKFGEEGKKLVIDRYNWTKIALEIERTYEKIL